ncbi:Gamma carbonic anhydrase family protein [Entamoeba marina]
MEIKNLSPFGGKSLKIAENVFITPGVSVIGDVEVHTNASLWFNAILRGDMAPIVVGEGSNVQDCTVVHTSTGKPTIIEKNVTVGHSAILHAYEIGDGSMVGIGFTTTDYSKIGKNCLFGVNASVTSQTIVPDAMLVICLPAKAVRPLKEGELACLKENIEEYNELVAGYELSKTVQKDN